MEKTIPDTKRPEELFEEGLDYFFRKYNAEQALNCFTAAIEIKCDYSQAYRERANIRRFLGDKKQAKEDIDESIKIDSQNGGAYYVKARILFGLGEKEEAEKCIGLVRDRVPEDAWSYFHKGAALFALGNLEKAIDCFDQAIKQDCNSAYVYYNKGNALNDLGKKEEAISCYDQAIELDPNDATTFNNKGYALIDLQKKKEAIECFDSAININPNFASAYHNKGCALLGLGKNEEAIYCFDHAIKLNDENGLYHLNKGKALTCLERDSEALECFNKAYELSKGSKGNTDLANKTPNEDKVSLIEQIRELQRVSIETEKASKKLKETADKILEKFLNLREKKTALTGELITSFHPSIEQNHKEKIDQEEEIEKIKKEMFVLKQQILDIQAKADQKLKAHQINIENSVHSDELNNKELEEGRKKLLEILAKETFNDQIDKNMLSTYYNAFAQTFLDVYLTSQLIESREIVADLRDPKTGVLTTIVSFIPVVQVTVVRDIEKFDQLMSNQEMINCAKTLKCLASDSCNLGALVSECCLEIIKNQAKQKRIISSENEQKEEEELILIDQMVKNKLHNRLGDELSSQIRSKLYDEAYQTSAAKEGHFDALKLIQSCLNQKRDQSEPLESIWQQFVNEIIHNDKELAADDEPAYCLVPFRQNCCQLF